MKLLEAILWGIAAGLKCLFLPDYAKRKFIMAENWLDEEVDFYDFVWAYGTSTCTDCINRELFDNFAAGGNKFEEMKKVILEKFPTREAAMQEFKACKKQNPS